VQSGHLKDSEADGSVAVR